MSTSGARNEYGGKNRSNSDGNRNSYRSNNEWTFSNTPWHGPPRQPNQYDNRLPNQFDYRQPSQYDNSQPNQYDNRQPNQYDYRPPTTFDNRPTYGIPEQPRVSCYICHGPHYKNVCPYNSNLYSKIKDQYERQKTEQRIILESIVESTRTSEKSPRKRTINVTNDDDGKIKTIPESG